jgi:hypothetical protein
MIRVVDVEQALSQRRTEVRATSSPCESSTSAPWNDGVWRVETATSHAGPHTQSPDLG